MSSANIESRYKEVKARYDRAKKRFDDAVTERDEFKAAAWGARQIHNNLKTAKGTKESPVNTEALQNAKQNSTMLSEAYLDAARAARQAQMAFLGVQGTLQRLQKEYDEFEKKQAAAKEAARKKEEAARKHEYDRKRYEQWRAQQEQDQQKRQQQKQQQNSGSHSGKRKREDEEPKIPFKVARPIAGRPITPKEKQDWFSACEKAFADRPSLKTLPSPPAQPCGSARCAADCKTRQLQACSCNIAEIFEGRSRALLKKDRVAFHPDRFAVCEESVREQVVAQVKEVSMVVNAMYG